MNGRTDVAWTDSHCHLHDLDDSSQLLQRATKARVGRLVCVGTSAASSTAALAFVRAVHDPEGHDPEGRDPVTRPQLFATIGQHPHDAASGVEAVTKLLASTDQITTGPGRSTGSVVGVGECGLDYHYDYSPRDRQRESFVTQIALAREYDLALVIHTREAWEDTFAILGAADLPERVIIHCFTGGPEEARRCLDLGAYLSFSGIVTFKNAGEIREAARLCPADRLLVETDAPYLAPVPHRGTANEPSYVALVGEALAEIRRTDVEAFAAQTSKNANAAFELCP